MWPWDPLSRFMLSPYYPQSYQPLQIVRQSNVCDQENEKQQASIANVSLSLTFSQYDSARYKIQYYLCNFLIRFSFSYIWNNVVSRSWDLEESGAQVQFSSLFVVIQISYRAYIHFSKAEKRCKNFKFNNQIRMKEGGRREHHISFSHWLKL